MYAYVSDQLSFFNNYMVSRTKGHLVVQGGKRTIKSSACVSSVGGSKQAGIQQQRRSVQCLAKVPMFTERCVAESIFHVDICP